MKKTNNKINCILYREPKKVFSKYWFIDKGFLYSYDPLAMETKKEYVFSSLNKYPYLYVEYVNGYLFMSPYEENRIAIYDFENRKMEYIDCQYEQEKPMCGRMFVYKSKIFMLSVIIENGIKIVENLRDVRTVCISDWYEDSKREGISTLNAVKDNYMWIPSHNSNKILKLDMDSEEYQLITIDDDDTGYSAIQIEEKYIWLTESRTGSLVCYDMVTKEVQKFSVPEGFDYVCKTKDYVHQDMFDFGDKIITIPSFANKMTIFDKQTQEYKLLDIEFLDSFDNRYKTNLYLTCCFGKKIDENFLWVQRTKDGLIANIDIRDFSYKTFAFEINQEEVTERFMMCLLSDKESIITESEDAPLATFIRCVGRS